VPQEAPLPALPAELSAVLPPAVSPRSLAPIAVVAKKPTQVADSELAIGIHRIRIWRAPELLK